MQTDVKRHKRYILRLWGLDTRLIAVGKNSGELGNRQRKIFMNLRRPI
jgi:hypothetical protein